MRLLLISVTIFVGLSFGASCPFCYTGPNCNTPMKMCFYENPNSVCYNGYPNPRNVSTIEGSNFTSIITSKQANGRTVYGIKMIDNNNNSTMFTGDPENWAGLWADPLEYNLTALQPQITLQSLLDGADITYNYFNNYSTPRSPGMWLLEQLITSANVTVRNFKFDWRPLNYSAGPNGAVPFQMFYHDWPVPWMYFEWDDNIVGISLQYPIVQYKHRYFVTGCNFPRIFFSMRHYGASNGLAYWQLAFKTYLDRDGPIQPNESRIYKISIRILKKNSPLYLNNPNPKTQQWLRVYAPYQSFFNCLYGGMNKLTSRKPGMGRVLAFTEFQNCTLYPNDCNILGYAPPRMDIYGWRPLVNNLANDFFTNNIPRVLLWATTGLFNVSTLNYPTFMTSHWSDVVNVSNSLPLFNSSTSNFTRNNYTVGLWWGYAYTYMNHWEPTEAVNVDINNATHMNQKYDELDRAYSYNVRWIGLDTMSSWAVWKLLPYMKIMMERHPDIEWVSENWGYDILGTVMGFWSEQNDRWLTPIYWADFLTPGHSNLIIGPNSASQCREFALLGYVCFSFSGFPFDKALINSGYYDANYTHCDTVPNDLITTDSLPQILSLCHPPFITTQTLTTSLLTSASLTTSQITSAPITSASVATASSSGDTESTASAICVDFLCFLLFLLL